MSVACFVAMRVCRVGALCILAAGLTFVHSARADVFLLDAELNGANARPEAVVTEATGKAIMSWNTETNQYNLSLLIQGLTLAPDNSNTVTAAHIHLGTSEEVGGGIEPLPVDTWVEAGGAIFANHIGINASSDLINNEVALLNEGTYLSVHTVANPGGEIRGQLIPEPVSIALLGVGLLMMMRRR